MARWHSGRPLLTEMNLAPTIWYVSALLAAAMALTVAWRDRRSLAHWGLAAGLAALAMESVCSAFSATAVGSVNRVYWQQWRFLAMGFGPGTWLLFSVTYARENHRESLVHWRAPLVAAFIVPLGLAAIFRDSLIEIRPGSTIPAFTSMGLFFYLVLLMGAIVVLMNLEVTLRAAAGLMRWRLKYMVFGIGAILAVRIYACGQVLVLGTVDFSLQAVNAGVLILACLIIGRALLHRGEVHVSFYPSLAFLMQSVTGLAAGLYLLMIGIAAQIVASSQSHSAYFFESIIVALGVMLLVMVLASDRVQAGTLRLVSRYFQRPQYDYRSVWQSFAAASGRHAEPPELSQAIVRLVSELFHALSVTIWIVDETKDGLTFAGSTALTKAGAAKVKLDPADVKKLIAGLAPHSGPVNLDRGDTPWAILLRRLHPVQFEHSDDRICVPLRVRGDLLALLVLADRVAGVPCSAQDLELLQSICDQAAASLLNLLLAQKLTQAKQLEAFQIMSAFFVHDLKNTASTLSLMLQNLPNHFQDPEFRADALQGIADTVNHINALINRLRLLRQQLAVKAVEADLNELVSDALQGVAPAAHTELVRVLKPVARVHVNPEQIRSVVTNLVLNAADAVGSGGQIRVETSQTDGWVVLTIKDNGCGMAPEFMEQLLFHPFQTTKENGIGIGMFQCKLIVEAHRGKIEVESKPGQGTAVRVLLPAQS